MAYEKTVWKNGQSPAINSTNLNKIEKGIEDAHALTAELEQNKVDKVTGKGLSSNDYTTTEKNKLAGIETGANKYTHPATHPASMIQEAVNKRFMTDAERAKLAGGGAGSGLNADKLRDKIPSNLDLKSDILNYYRSKELSVLYLGNGSKNDFGYLRWFYDPVVHKIYCFSINNSVATNSYYEMAVPSNLSPDSGSMVKKTVANSYIRNSYITDVYNGHFILLCVPTLESNRFDNTYPLSIRVMRISDFAVVREIKITSTQVGLRGESVSIFSLPICTFMGATDKILIYGNFNQTYTTSNHTYRKIVINGSTPTITTVTEEVVQSLRGDLFAYSYQNAPYYKAGRYVGGFFESYTEYNENGTVYASSKYSQGLNLFNISNLNKSKLIGEYDGGHLFVTNSYLFYFVSTSPVSNLPDYKILE